MKITPNLSPDPFDPDFHPLNAFLDSLKTVGNLKIQTVWPAHGEPFSDLKKRIGEISDHHKERRDLILDSITKGPKTVFEISADIFGRNNLSGFDGFFALNETYVHIMELVHEGTVKERKEDEKDPFLTYEKITHG
jgi:glyoxylase-like metal-dependent hydrolase (beta-lactamase superfamily II)